MLQLLADSSVDGAAASGTHRGGDGAGSDGLAIGNVELGLGVGSRWPKEETLALLQIRSDLDGVFRDSGYKGPVWDDVSRKMAEKGFRRSSKKCREKFENMYKYHLRTKEGRSSKSDGKTYRFFDQLEALHISSPSSSTFPMATPPPQPPLAITPPPQLTLTTNSPFNWPLAPLRNTEFTKPTVLSSSSSSDEEIVRKRSRRHSRYSSKRKWKDFFVKLTEDVMKKQDDLQKKFMDELYRREHEQRIREEAWKMNEITRLNQIREILNQERAMASAKEVALITYLEKLSGDQRIPPLPQPFLHPQPPTPPAPAAENQDKGAVIRTRKRWPREEIEALIKVRANMEEKYQVEGAKGALWEEISGTMKTMGYNRSGKRCKQKWENIHRYYKKVQETNKKPRLDSKTCRYYYQLEALYSGASTSKAPAAEQDDEDGDDEDGDHDDEEEEGGNEEGGNEVSGEATAAMEGLSVE